MSELALFLVRTGFLIVLWIFIFSIISVIRSDLFGQRIVSKVTAANAPKVLSSPSSPASPLTAAPEAPDGKTPRKLVVTEGERSGLVLALEQRELTIGRSKDSDLVVDDEYASTHHAKLVQLNDKWIIQDLNSTNGTFLDGNKVGTPAEVRLNTPVKVGQTTFELRA